MATRAPWARAAPGAPPPPAAAVPQVDPAAAAALHARGGELLPDRRGVRVNGWRVETEHKPIMGRDDLRSTEEAVSARALPEMVFGTRVELTHEASGTVIAFNALDALREWKEEALPPIQVACAAAWSRAHNIALREGAIKGWDAAGVREGDASAYDWTFTTPYGGSLRAGGADPAPQWQPVDERIDRTLLLARDPILFYDEATLYESELDDNGTMSLALKVRVMPACWYVLLRFWLRVDGVLVRLRETRIFCKTGSAASGGGATVLRERSVREETFDELRLRCAPATIAQYPDAETASQVLLAAGGPVTVAYERLDIAPPVGDRAP